MPDAVIVGGGQAGLAASACLTRRGIDHVVLEKGDIGESWRRQRWDSFCLVTPNWTVRLPGQEYDGPDRDGFMSGAAFVAFLEHYAARVQVPLWRPVEATRATPSNGHWDIDTTGGRIRTRALVVATSNYQRPSLPSFAGALGPGIVSIGAAKYRAADRLPPGRILVVGSAQSGSQIVEDLRIAGRDVILGVSRAGRVQRRYRGRDAIDWQDRMGFLDRKAAALDDPRDRFGGEPHMTGRDGGHTLSLQNFHANGVRLIGRVKGGDGTTLHLESDLRANIVGADRFAARFRDAVDMHIQRTGMTAPSDDGDDHAPVASPARFSQPERIDLAAEGVSTVIWATGFRFDYSWVAANVFDAYGYPITRRGETTAPGLYFLGLNFLHSRKSGIIYGVGEDAEYVAGRIQRYLDDRRS